MTPVAVIRDAVARIIVAGESLECGSTFEAAQILADLENDLSVALHRFEEAKR